MKEGAYHDWLREQLLEDYLFLLQVSTNPKMKEIATHIAKAEVAIGTLSGRVKDLERQCSHSQREFERDFYKSLNER